jgi:hypothetical protein
MGRKPLVDQAPEDSRDILPGRIKSGNISEISPRHGIAPHVVLSRVGWSRAGSEGSASWEKRCGRRDGEGSPDPTGNNIELRSS